MIQHRKCEMMAQVQEIVPNLLPEQIHIFCIIMKDKFFHFKVFLRFEDCADSCDVLLHKA